MYDDVTLGRFWDKVDKLGPDDCWEWKAARSDNGYGKITIDKKRRIASRVSLQIKMGRAILPKLMALHSCDNPPCVNPNHLREGTHGENSQDMVDRGRQVKWNGRRKGEANPRARLTLEQVAFVRVSPLGSKRLCRHLGVGRKTIRDIRQGKTWTL